MSGKACRLGHGADGPSRRAWCGLDPSGPGAVGVRTVRPLEQSGAVLAAGAVEAERGGKQRPGPCGETTPTRRVH